MARAAPKLAPATTSLSVYTVIEVYKQTDSAILHLFTYLPHNLSFIPPFKSIMARTAPN